MAKYLDENGLQHFMSLIKTGIANVSTTLIARTHRHTIGSSTGSAASVTAGTAASLSTTTKTFVTSASKLTMGTAKPIKPIIKKTVVTGGSTTSIPNISVAAATTDTVKGVNVFTANIPSSASVSSHKFTITNGTAASLTTTNKTFTTDATKATAGTAIDAYTSLTTGDSVTEGTEISVPQFTVADAATGTVKGVDTFTANTPTAVTPATVVTSVDANTGYASI